MWYCSSAFPKDLVCDICGQSVAQDPLRSDLWRVHLMRNDALMNCHMPAATLGNQSNTDGQPVATRHQAEEYCCKYICKHCKGQGARTALYELMDDMHQKDTAAKVTYGEESVEARTIGGKLHKAFMAEVGEEMCQTEVAHHANRCPQYFCSRPQRHVHLYKKALGVTTVKNKAANKQDEAWDDGAWDGEDGGVEWRDPRKRITKPSDLELYERRLMYPFAEDCGLSEFLPIAPTPMEQLARASLYEFFRLVRFHGGRYPYLSWHEPDDMPIVMMSPVVKLAEGPDFSFGARWALMQHHSWMNRQQFLEMEDAEVKNYFREWISSEQAPWYIEEQYIRENKKRLRTVSARAGRRSAPGAATAASGIDGNSHLEDPNEGGELVDNASVTEDSAAELQAKEDEANMHVLKMLYKGDVSQVNRREEQKRRSGIFNNRHNFYKHTSCTSTAQEEHSALPAGVLNVCEDSDDENDYVGEEKEIEQEMQQLRVAHQWINQEGWDLASERKALSANTGAEVDLRLEWEEVARQLASGSGENE